VRSRHARNDWVIILGHYLPQRSLWSLSPWCYKGLMGEQHNDDDTALLVDCLVAIPASVASTQVGEDTLVHDMITQQLYQLNAVGTRIWELIDSGSTIRSIVQTVGTEYQLPDDIPPSQLHADVLAVVTALRGHGLVVVSDSGQAGSRILKSTNC
jgi:hypothetical protein